MLHAIIALGQQTRSNDIRRGMQSLLWAAQTVERRRAWHPMIAFGQHRRSDGVGRCMPSPALASTHNQTTSGVACHHRLWGAHRIERCRAWHTIITFVQHTQSNDVGRGITSPPLDSTHDRQRRAWHDITVLGQHTRSDDVGRGMTSPPLDGTNGWTT